MSGGITPIDNAFEWIGLHQCSALMRLVFVETLAGKAIFALGFILALARSLKRADLKAVMIYCAIFFSCLILLVIPKTVVNAIPSTMESYGYTQMKTEDILRKAGIDQLT